MKKTLSTIIAIGILSFSTASADTPQKIERTMGSNGVTKITIKNKNAPAPRAHVRRSKKTTEFKVYDLGGDGEQDEITETDSVSTAPSRRTTVVAQPPPIYPQSSGYQNGYGYGYGPGFIPANGQRYRDYQRFRGNRRFQGQNGFHSSFAIQANRSPFNYQVPPLNYRVPPLNPGINSSRYYSNPGGFGQTYRGNPGYRPGCRW